LQLGGGRHEALYNAILVGAAALCVARAALVRSERVAWALMGLALASWAGGELYWTVVLADVAEPPFPSVADALWLGFLPAAYLAVVLLVRQRIPHVDSRLWLDRVIGALTVGALSAAIVFAAVGRPLRLAAGGARARPGRAAAQRVRAGGAVAREPLHSGL
jgi:hypothetical protein